MNPVIPTPSPEEPKPDFETEATNTLPTYDKSEMFSTILDSILQPISIQDSPNTTEEKQAYEEMLGSEDDERFHESDLIPTHLTSSHRIPSCLISPHPISSHHISSHFITFHPIPSVLTSSQLISSHLITSQPISSVLIDSVQMTCSDGKLKSAPNRRSSRKC